MFDTHCHLQFSAFEGRVNEIVEKALQAGVTHIVVPGTDIETSEKGSIIAQKYEHIYASVGIHPHHIYQIKNVPRSGIPLCGKKLVPSEDEELKVHNYDEKLKITKEIEKIEDLLKNKDKKIVAVGEIGLDRHQYKKTKYEHYHIDESFIALQKELFIAQLQLAKKYKKSVIIHNRETRDELLEILRDHWASDFEGHMVFHCCEPDDILLDFAIQHHVFIGIDGDITYRKDKQEFIKKVPLDLIVLETDAPFLLPEPFRTQKAYPNKPAHIPYIAKAVALLLKKDVEKLSADTDKNARALFYIS